VVAPVPDVTMWISKLAERFEVEVSPHVSLLFDELAARCFGGITFADVGERAALPPRAEKVSDTFKVSDTGTGGPGLRLVAYRPLFSGTAVDRTPELQFQRPATTPRRAGSRTARPSRSRPTARRLSYARVWHATCTPVSSVSRRSTPATCTRRSR
jgi:hypothetical protein